jgi:hypothetical protein
LLYEIKNAKPYESGKRIKWYSDDYFDLAVWFDDEGISSFQLCYGLYFEERALTWRKNFGFTHDNVDSGDRPGMYKGSPILVPDGIFNKSDILKRFEKESVFIEPRIREFILSKIGDY